MVKRVKPKKEKPAPVDFSAYDLAELSRIQEELRRTYVAKLLDDLLPLREQHRALMDQIERAVSPHGLTALEFLEGTRKELERRMLNHLMRDSRARKGFKYVHPRNPSLVWHGQGKRPRWLHDLLQAGYALEALRVEEAPEKARPTKRGGGD